jgi:hypothetical protein
MGWPQAGLPGQANLALLSHAELPSLSMFIQLLLPNVSISPYSTNVQGKC